MTDNLDNGWEYYISNNNDVIIETKDHQLNDIVEKDFSDSWLKIQEKNLIQLGNERLTNPAANNLLVYKCMTVIAENVATVPLLFFDKKTKNPVDEYSPIYKTFHSPNPYDNLDDLLYATAAYYTLYGEAFIATLSTTGKNFEMWALDPMLMKEIVNKKTGMLEGWVYNKKQSFELDEILQIKRRNPYNQWRGLSPLVAADTELNIDNKASKYQSSLLSNGAVPGGLITFPEARLITEEEIRKIRKTWEDRHKGPNKASRVAVLKEGMKYEKIAFNGEELQFIDSRKLTRENILLTFGVPSVVAGLTEGVNRTSAEAQLKLFWRITIKPLLERIESKINYDLLPSYYPQIVCKFDYRKIDELRKDFKSDVESAKSLFLMGFSRNEINYRFDFGFDENKDMGDISHIPVNVNDVKNVYKLSLNNEVDNNMKKETENTKDVSKDKPETKQLELNDRFILLIPKIRNFFRDEKKKLVKNIANRENLDKTVYKDIKSILNDEKDKFKTRFVDDFHEIILEKQIKKSGISDKNSINLKIDKEVFNDEYSKFLTIFDVILNKIVEKTYKNLENKKDFIENTKLIYASLSKSLEDNVLSFNKQLIEK